MEFLTALTFQFESLSELAWMKGHGPYVWGAYLITFVGLGYLMVVPVLKKKHFFKLQKAANARLAHKNIDH